MKKYENGLIKLNFTHYISWLLRIFEKYLWCIPSSSYKTIPDISLYDHLKVTASVAQALWVYYTETANADILKDPGPTKNKTFILMGGDLSGIQRFIFDISETGKGLTRLIRGRSFYLQLLINSIVLYIFKKLGLYHIGQIVDAGGKFILLLPNTEKVKTFILDLKKEVDEFFVKRFKGILTLSIAYRETAEEELLLKNFSDTLNDLNHLLDREKSRKLFNYLVEHGSVIDFDYKDFSDGICSICGIHPAKEEGICRFCYDQKEIGTHLPRTRYIAFNLHKGISLFGNIKVLLKEKDFYPDENEMEMIYSIRKEAQKYANMWTAGYLPKIREEDIEDKDFLSIALKETETKEEKELIGEPKTLELISYKALKRHREDIVGRNLLCVFKADVDNLGLIFSIGLQKRLSISRYSSLSRMLNLFFSGYLVEKIKNRYKDIYVVFSGGDDVFLVGPWNQTIDFAIELRDEFKKFCADNKDISISCGLYIMRPKYPVRRAARDAEAFLDKAKERKENSVLVKDGVCIFDTVISWEQLKEQVKFGKWLEEKVLDESSKINRAFIYRLLNYMKAAKRCEQSDKAYLNDLMFYPHALYDIARNIIKKDKEDKIINEQEVNYILDRIDPFKEGKKLEANIVGIQYALCAIRR